MENASARDWDAIRELLALCGLPHEDLTPGHLADFLVIRDPGGKRVLGAAGLEYYGRAGLLRSLAVAPESRGQGWGTLLASGIESAAIERALDELFVLTTSAPEFFLALGYQIVARETAPMAIRESTQFASVCPDTAVCLSRQISGMREPPAPAPRALPQARLSKTTTR